MGILLRRMAPRALIHGFFLLPWVYRGKSFAHRVRQNAYAALSEIDNLQSIMYGDDRFYRYSIGYSDLEKEPVDTAPYDLFHVIDGRNDFGQNVDSVQELCEIVSNAVFLSMGSMRVNVTSVVDNLLAHISVGDPKLWNGRYARYSSLGVSSIHYPAIEMHRLASATVARDLCRAALRELDDGGQVATRTDERRGGAGDDVKAFITELNLNRNNVTTRLCPRHASVEFAIENFEIADPDFPALIKDRLSAEKKSLELALERSFEGPSRVFADGTMQSLEQRLAEIAADTSMDRSTRSNWISDLVAHVKGLQDAVAEQLKAATDDKAGAEKNADALLDIAEKSRYLPMIGGPRKSAVNKWAEAARKLLNTMQQVRNLEHEKAFYTDLAQRLNARGSLDVPTRRDLFDALSETENRLQDLIALETKNLEVLRTRPNHVLLGDGRTVVWNGAAAGNESADKSASVGEIECDYAAFREEAKIQTMDDYLDLYKQSPNALVEKFLHYCSRRFEAMREITVVEALRSLAAEKPDPDRYSREQFDHLFRLAAPLWSFEMGRVGELQDLEVGKIVNIGFTDHQRELPEFKGIAEDMRHAFHIGSDLAYSTTGDPQHIWMLSFAATIPAYLITGMEQARKVYEEQISPSFHIDTEFEKELPDLLPEHEDAAGSLRILGMAIIGGIELKSGTAADDAIKKEMNKGIDVVHDEKLSKGHRFTFDDPAVRAFNFGEPIEWRLFRDMYNDVQQNQDGLQTLLADRLKRRIEELLALKPSAAFLSELATATAADVRGDPKGSEREASSQDPRQLLKALIENHIKKLEEKLASRDFSRLYSARLTYREIQELKYFLDNRRYAMDIDRYIQGSFVPRNNAQ